MLCLFIPLFTQSLATTDLFTFSIVLSFPECHMVVPDTSFANIVSQSVASEIQLNNCLFYDDSLWYCIWNTVAKSKVIQDFFYVIFSKFYSFAFCQEVSDHFELIFAMGANINCENSTFKKLKSWHSVPSLHGEKMGKQWKQSQTLFSWAPKSLQMVTATIKLKDACIYTPQLW